MGATFYCDESGNTGTDWGNVDQPIFIHGGWLVRDETSKSQIIAGIRQLRAKHRLGALELKSRQISRRRNSSEIFREFFTLGLKQGALPFFQVADKDYLVAAKAVETYFDPAYNHSLPMAFTANAGRKKKIAEGLLNDPGLLRQFAALLRAGEAPPDEVVRQIGRDVASCLRSVGQEKPASWIPEYTVNEVNDIQEEFNTSAWMRTTTAHTLWSVLQQLEMFLRPRDLAVNVIHDNIVRFDDLLDVVRGMFRPSTGQAIPLLDGRAIQDAFSKITGLDLADSREEPLLQFSDLLCAHLRIIFTKLKGDIALDDEERKTALDLAVLMLEFQTWEWNVPVAMQEAFGGEFGSQAREKGDKKYP